MESDVTFPTQNGLRRRGINSESGTIAVPFLTGKGIAEDGRIVDTHDVEAAEIKVVEIPTEPLEPILKPNPKPVEPVITKSKKKSDAFFAYLNTKTDWVYDFLKKNTTGIRNKAVNILFKAPLLANIVFSNEQSGPSSAFKFAKRADTIFYNICKKFIMIIIAFMIIWYIFTPKEQQIEYIKYKPTVQQLRAYKDINTSCRPVNTTDFVRGKITLNSNKTHLVFIDINDMLNIQKEFLVEKRDWTDVVCASMFPPHDNISMPCSCSAFTQTGVISGFNFHIDSYGGGTAMLTETVPVIGDTKTVQVARKLYISYFDAITQRNSELVMQDGWVGTGYRLQALMFPPPHA